MAEKKKSEVKLFIALAVVVLIVAAAWTYMQSGQNNVQNPVNAVGTGAKQAAPKPLSPIEEQALLKSLSATSAPQSSGTSASSTAPKPLSPTEEQALLKSLQAK